MGERERPEWVVEQLRVAIRPEVDACIEDRVRHWRIQTWVLYGFTFAMLVLVGYGIVYNARTIDDLCSVAQNQRHTLELQKKNTAQYLKSPQGAGPGGLNEFIRAVSVPQLRDRLEREQVPARCR